MASPVGHGLFALFATRFFAGERGSSSRWFGFAVFAVLAADLDFLPGILLGDPSRFHHGASHSLFAAVLFSVALLTFARTMSLPAVKTGIAGGVLYASHLLLDFLTKDTGAPIGQPLLWPFSERYFALAAAPLSNIVHGPNSSLLEFFRAVFSTHNLSAVGRELLLLVPPLVGLWFLADWRRWRRCNAEAARERCREHTGSPSSITSVD